MVRLAGPGGMVAVAEPDTEHALCYPPDPAFDRICAIFAVAFSRNGADPATGRRVPELFRQAGLACVEAELRTQMYPPGNSRRTVRLDLVDAMRPQIVEMGLASGQETNWTRRPVPILKIRARSSCPACCSWSGAASQPESGTRAGTLCACRASAWPAPIWTSLAETEYRSI
jgi:hypothetical protein